MQSPLPERWWIVNRRQCLPQANWHNITASDDKTLAWGKWWKRAQGGQWWSALQKSFSDWDVKYLFTLLRKEGSPGAHEHRTFRSEALKMEERYHFPNSFSPNLFCFIHEKILTKHYKCVCVYVYVLLVSSTQQLVILSSNLHQLSSYKGSDLINC